MRTGQRRSLIQLLLWLASVTGPPFRKLMHVSPVPRKKPINLNGDGSNCTAKGCVYPKWVYVALTASKVDFRLALLAMTRLCNFEWSRNIL